ncbi:MAG TPA: hypothetical protein VK642_03445 [Burkholderiales bacterium]|nr:hypothetical protein [Burkholderiales bacterium]
MALAGLGAITIWQDARADARADFLEWHNREHIPERVGISGFLRGRRWMALKGAPEFFTLYETTEPQVHTSAGYLERLNNPSPWTRRIAPSMENNIRSLCRVAYSAGSGQGGLLVTLRYDVAPESEDVQLRLVTGQMLPELGGMPGVTGTHLCLADKAASFIQTEEKKSRPQRALVPTWVILVEGAADSASLVAACGDTLRDDVLAAAGATGISRGLYQLQYSRSAASGAIG